jgi:LETM1 and EF-hand domain-containing protein 1, mitochondrial
MQIELYNSMLEKEGAEGEEEAKRAYIAAREESGRRLLQKKMSHQ